MKLIKLKPATSGTRHQKNLSKNLLAKSSNLYKNIIFTLKQCSGHSTQTGHITVWNRGNGCKKRFRKINFQNYSFKGIVLTQNYDPYRSAFISLIFNLTTQVFFYTLSAHITFPGSLLCCQKKNTEFFIGARTILQNIPIGAILFNVSLEAKGLAKYSRAAGTFTQLIHKKEITVQLRLSSGKILEINSLSCATFGRTSNLKHSLVTIGKAGRNRLKGMRPHVRGVAMNPVDHPHGGRTKGGRPSVSPWGILTKGKPTVKHYE